MNQIAAIALLALRNALRSRVILVLLLLVLAAAFLLPHAIRHDGTPEGLIRLHLAYSLGIAGFLLTLASLWAGCAAISQEADDKTLQLVLVKPVPRLRIWLGKWLALLLINALLLTVVGILDAVTLQAALRRSQFEPEALARARQTTLAALEPVQAPLPDIKTEVQAEYEALRARHLLPENVPESTLLDSIKRTLLARAYAIPPGGTHAWRFRVPAHLPPTFFVQFKADSSVPGSAEIQARLDVHIGGHIMSREIDAMPGTRQMLLFTNSPSLSDTATEISAVFSNHGAYDATLFFDPTDGLVLRLPRGTFSGNYLRALASLYLRLALFAALGVTFGTLVSMPVATVLTLVLSLILQLSGFISASAQVDRATFVANVAPFGAGAHSHGDETEEPAPPSPLARATATVLYYTYRGTWLTLRPLLENRSLDDLSTGTRLPPRDLLRDLWQQGIFLPLLLAGLSTLVLKRREWALPAVN